MRNHDSQGTMTNCCNDATIMIHSIHATMRNNLTQVIYDAIETIVTGDSDDMADLQMEMVDEVSSMLPQ